MDSDVVAWQRRSVAPVIGPASARKLAKVPFVELADGRLQGVVSSGSDISRVYVTWLSAAGHAYHCSTNNNRPCGGMRGHPCNHLRALFDNAVQQYGAVRVGRRLGVAADDTSTGDDLMARLDGRHEPTPEPVVFSRFLRHLRYLELPNRVEPIPELHWFPATGAR